MGLSKLVQQPAEAEQLDLRTFGRPPMRLDTQEKKQIPTATYTKLQSIDNL